MVLHKSKAAIGTKNQDGETAIMHAAKGKLNSRLKLLERNGASLPVALKKRLSINQKMAVLKSSITGVYNNWKVSGKPAISQAIANNYSY